jgi:hypothetical protein
VGKYPEWLIVFISCDEVRGFENIAKVLQNLRASLKRGDIGGATPIEAYLM